MPPFLRLGIGVLLALASCTASEPGDGVGSTSPDRGPVPAYVLREHEAEYRGPGREEPPPEIAERDLLEEGIEYLPKPFTREALLDRIRSTLDGR